MCAGCFFVREAARPKMRFISTKVAENNKK
jgi:hypothetical protein